MFKKVLVSNRGEIALRIIRALKEMNIKSVIVYSEADRDSIAVRLADDRVCVGPAPAPASYLNISQIISAAVLKKCDALHPGYGFLAENHHFAEICKSYNITFIGPTPTTIALAGKKAEVIELLKSKGVPVVPGSHAVCKDVKSAKKIAASIRYPVIIKASAGGGGKGMRIVEKEDELAKAFEIASSEAQGAFGNSDIYIEKYIENPRHIEIQIAADGGDVVYFPERDCSIQRHHQKIIEEAPSPKITPKLRKKLGETAIRIAKILNYTTVGTVEFLVSKNNFYFMEINARIQVEHPITELISDVDMAKIQITLAAGEKLPLRQGDIAILNNAIECRINSEDEDFIPSSGVVRKLFIPGGPGVRVDTAISQGDEISPFYDSLIAKVITWGASRSEAIVKMKRALDEFIIEGVDTNIPLHRRILENENFLKGCYSTSFLEEMNGKNQKNNK
ncbi:MAG: acetyl-CoA carboxylase biotin carboxylase subunit [Elusimicrobia bacterium]|nr:acetyl-CoA carboxylase biotin carboxylase subunit [Elusimicrobiota bacterium]